MSETSNVAPAPDPFMRAAVEIALEDGEIAIVLSGEDTAFAAPCPDQQGQWRVFVLRGDGRLDRFQRLVDASQVIPVLIGMTGDWFSVTSAEQTSAVWQHTRDTIKRVSGWAL